VVPASEFVRMGWPLTRLGPQAIVYPGQQQHARAAVQQLSGPIQQVRIFTHLGLEEARRGLGVPGGRRRGGSARAPARGFQVQLPAGLQHYQVRLPTDPGELVSAIRASLECLSLAPDRISFPLLASVYRAPWGGTDFSMFLTGRTGTFKIALAALCQQHFPSGSRLVTTGRYWTHQNNGALRSSVHRTTTARTHINSQAPLPTSVRLSELVHLPPSFACASTR
jgi:hypothetical protein